MADHINQYDYHNYINACFIIFYQSVQQKLGCNLCKFTRKYTQLVFTECNPNLAYYMSVTLVGGLQVSIHKNSSISITVSRNYWWFYGRVLNCVTKCWFSPGHIKLCELPLFSWMATEANIQHDKEKLCGIFFMLDKYIKIDTGTGSTS